MPASTVLRVRQGDRRPPIGGVCRRNGALPTTANGGQLSDATGIRFHLRNIETGTLEVDAAATVVSSAAGTVRYDWAAGDTDVVGWYHAEFEVTWSVGVTESFPNGPLDELTVVIFPDVA